MQNVRLLLGDSAEVLKQFEANSIDALVCDPPAGINFMGKAFDSDLGGRKEWCAWLESVMRECMRVMKPGAHGLVWALPRTSHWTATALEDAGFRIKDTILHCFGSGFPKSTNVKLQAEKAGIACVCRKDLSDLPKELDADHALSSSAKQNVRTDLQWEKNKLSEDWQASKAWREMLYMQQRVLAQTKGDIKSQNMQLSVPRCNAACKPGVCCSPSGDCTHGADGLDCPEPCQLSRVYERSEQPSLERRGNVQTQQGELHRPEVCSVSKGISRDGSQGRLRHGASASDGSIHGASFDSNGSGAPQGSQHSQQLDRESGVVPGQPITQTCGRCGKARFAEGYGSHLKPAVEIWWLIQKPIEPGLTISANVLKWGTGALNIDVSRIATAENCARSRSLVKDTSAPFGRGAAMGGNGSALGRFPSHLILDEEAGAMLDAQSGPCKTGALTGQPRVENKIYGKAGATAGKPRFYTPDAATGASRFFYCAKTSTRERNEGLDGTGIKNVHPTLKPQRLMRYLCKLITPPKGVVLDPFMGSGSTGLAARSEGFEFIGIEREKEYFDIAEARISRCKDGLEKPVCCAPDGNCETSCQEPEQMSIQDFVSG